MDLRIKRRHAQANDLRYVSASLRIRNLVDDADGYGDMRRTLSKRQRIGRRVASRRRRAGAVPASIYC